MGNELLSTKEAAIRLGVTPMRVRALIAAGRLPSQLVGRDHIIKESDLALVAERKAGRPKKEDAAAAANGSTGAKTATQSKSTRNVAKKGSKQ